MTLRHFEVFLSVYDGGGMTAASRALNVAQPAISRTVRELEERYGVRLFERLSKRIYPTEAAQRLVPYARHILGLYGNMERELHRLAAESRLRLGASVTVASSVLRDLLDRFAGLHPACVTTVVVDNTSVVENLLLRDRLDLGIVEGRVGSSELLVEPFLDDELVLVVPPSHPFAALKSVRAADLAGAPFIVREEGSGTRELFARSMEAAGIPWTEAWTCNNVETIKLAVAGGYGISVLSRRSVEGEDLRGKLVAVPVEGLELRRSFSLVRHRNKFLSGAMRDFASACGSPDRGMPITE